ncbi:peptide chain release factor 2 [bacterium]|nr:peptide chain release factor 2 [bacterium]
MTCGGCFDLETKTNETKNLQQQTENADFWLDKQKAQNTLKEIKIREEWILPLNDCKKTHKDLSELLELAQNDTETLELLKSDFTKLEQKLAELEFKNMLSEKDDPKNALLTIHPGAGGTESQDWAEMLLRMYTRWAEKRRFKTETIDFQSGDTAGIKSVTIEIKGDFAYGYLKSEIGIHRLVRLSPFDSSNKRHTSFASVFVLPEIEENDTEIVINPAEIRVDTFRASGAGGQHVNKTDSAIRITHLPTGTVVQCQTERSQYSNKSNAMKLLKSKLYEIKIREEQKEIDKLEEAKTEIGWGNQIRSYVFHPYNLVKDHRTKAETSDTQNVMDGEIDFFMKSYLSNFKILKL